jgi:hypothetical protein
MHGLHRIDLGMRNVHRHDQPSGAAGHNMQIMHSGPGATSAAPERVQIRP